MNTIPTIFNQPVTPYTAVGGKERSASTGITAVILNRKGQYQHRSFFQELDKSGFDNIVSIESSSPHYDIEELSGRFPNVRFVLPEREINLGEQINLAAAEVESPLFLVLRNDMKIIAGGTAERMAERLTLHEETDENENKPDGFKRLCTVPVLINSCYEPLPTLASPVIKKRKMRTVLMDPRVNGQCCLYPFDGIGIYDRSRFIQTGGFDISINNKYWQLMDFGFRSYLWGEEIALSLQLKFSCEGETSSEDYTVEESYSRFYLKNLAPVFRGDYANLPFSRFISFIFKSGEDIFSSWNDYTQIKKWVKTNKFRWKHDARAVTGLWGNTQTTGESSS